MKISRKVMVSLFPFMAILAGCQTTGSSSATAEPQQISSSTNTANVTPAQDVQAASVEVFAASAKKVKSYRPIPLSKTHTIYVSPKPIFTRTDMVTVGTPVQDAKKNVYVHFNLNEKGVAALKTVPKGQGFVTVIGGQVASLRGFRKDNGFYFQVKDEAAAKAISEAVIGQKK